MRRVITIAIFIIIFSIGAAFSAINIEPISINYYLDSVSLPLSVLVILSLVAGIIIGATAIYISSLRLRYDNSRLQKKLVISEQEINTLRILPIKDTL